MLPRRTTTFEAVGEFIIPPAVRREIIQRHDDNPAAVPAVTRDGIRYIAAVSEDMDGNRKFKVRREGVSSFTYQPESARNQSRRGAATQRRK
jgi:hypothetical protein